MGTVLIVDDDASILSVLHRIIEGEGHMVLEAAGGAEALQVLKAHNVDLAFVDIIMPGMDGVELMSRMRTSYPDVKLAPMSAFAGSRSLLNELAAVAFLVKPFTIEDLRAVLAQAFEQNQTGA